MRTSGASIVAFTTLSAALHLKPPVHHHHLRGGAVSCLATTYDAAFPEGFDPNYYPADARTYASVAGTATAPAIDRELNKLLPTFDFDQSTDAEVEEVEKAIFAGLRREAEELTASFLTSGLVDRIILDQSGLPAALALLLSGKLHFELPGTLKYSSVGGARAESATAEEALRVEMLRIFATPAVRRAVTSDLCKVLVIDPAAEGLLQPFLFFKGFHALATHRVAHCLWTEGTPSSKGAALLLQSRGCELFSVDLHPGAAIGNGVMLDHASGVVIGSTAIVGSDVYMLHGVTLGATGKPTDGAKRHPTVGSRCILGAGATVLGDIRVGDGCTVGAAAIVTKDVEDGNTVVGVNKVVERKDMPADKAKTTDDYTWYFDI